MPRQADGFREVFFFNFVVNLRYIRPAKCPYVSYRRAALVRLLHALGPCARVWHTRNASGGGGVKTNLKNARQKRVFTLPASFFFPCARKNQRRPDARTPGIGRSQFPPRRVRHGRRDGVTADDGHRDDIRY